MYSPRLAIRLVLNEYAKIIKNNNGIDHARKEHWLMNNEWGNAEKNVKLE